MNVFLGRKNKQIEAEIDKYLDNISIAGLEFFEGVKAYLDGQENKFDSKYKGITKLETEIDDIRRDIKHQLYTYMLIPESRGDVLGLVETLDQIVDVCEKVIQQFSIEKPDIPEFLKGDILDITRLSVKSMDEVVKATRAFFREINMVNNYVNKVHFYEHEVDVVEERCKRKVFGSDKIKKFSHRVHLRYFIERIASVSDVAEHVSDRLSVYAIKRRM
ncbi:MAG: DUF47 family protein [Candidatus Cloacimonadota bacterium]|nr:DUF47 family protein [Candidatus Cloacimonadota bacterium]